MSENVGYWGKRTATIDWCESNYEVTTYVAEFWNTISNLVMILFPLYAIYWSFKHRQLTRRNKSRYQFIIPNSTIYCQFGLLLVGIGSWMFHMTLLYPMQLLDELPMLYCAGLMIYANFDLILEVNKFGEKDSTGPSRQKSSFRKLIESRCTIFSLIAFYCAVCSFVYMSVWKNPVFHEVANGVQVFFIIATNLYLNSKLKASSNLLKMCTFYYFLGFCFWNIDNHFCDHLKSYRDFLDTTFGIDGSSNLKSVIFNAFVVCLKSIFEFHSIWHIFTGFGSYLTILYTIEGNYQLFLAQTGQITKKKVIDLKYGKMYYHLSNELIEKSKII